MYLAIVGALMLVDRALSSFFDVYIPIVVAVVVILYTTRATLKDGLILSVGVFVLTFLFGSLYTMVYNVIATLTGIIYGHFAKKGADRRLLMGLAILAFVIGEFIVTVIVSPLLGYDSLAESYEMIAETFEVLAGIGGLVISISDGMVKLMIALVIFFTGALEGVLIHLLAVICLKKLKIKVIKTTPLDRAKLKPIYAYILLLLVGMMMVVERFALGEVLTYGIYCLGIVAAVILVAQGYIFALVYGAVVLKRNISLPLIFIVLFLFPESLLMLLILGFMYATGPLDRYLEKKRRTNA